MPVERRLAVRNFVLQRDPQIFRRRLGRRQLVPVCQHGFLNPVQVAGIIDVPHEINVSGQNTNTVQVGESVWHIVPDMAVLRPV